MKIYRWLASFADPGEADKFLHQQTKKLKGLGMTDEYSLAIVTENGEHHVNLYKRSQ